MNKKDKENIKSTIYKRALKDFERNYMHFLKKPTLENYIEVKNAQQAYLDCQIQCVNENIKSVVDGILKTQYKCFEFKKIEKFEEILKLRDERNKSATKILLYLTQQEEKAKKMGKQIRYEYSAILLDFLCKLDDVELNTYVDKKFPKVSYIKLPSPSKIKLLEIRKLKDYELELDL